MLDYPQGTLVPAPITNGVAIAKFPTHLDFIGAGGLRTVDTIAARDGIVFKDKLEYDSMGSGMRRHMMVVTVSSVEKQFILYVPGFNNLTDAQRLAALQDNGNWVEYSQFLSLQINKNALTADELAAIHAANSPSANNVFVTQQDLAKITVPTIDESNLVHKTGDEIINGIKTFSVLDVVNISNSSSISLGTLLAPNGGQDMYFSVGHSLSGSQAALIGFTTQNNSAFLTTFGRPASDLLVTSGGNIGMGTSSPSERLEVDGNVKANNFIGSGKYLTDLPSGNHLPATESNPDEYTVNNVVYFKNKVSVPYASDDDDAVSVSYANNAFLRVDVQSDGSYVINNAILSNENVSADKFIGDGSQLTNLPQQLTTDQKAAISASVSASSSNRFATISDIALRYNYLIINPSGGNIIQIPTVINNQFFYINSNAVSNKVYLPSDWGIGDTGKLFTVYVGQYPADIYYFDTNSNSYQKQLSLESYSTKTLIINYVSAGKGFYNVRVVSGYLDFAGQFKGNYSSGTYYNVNDIVVETTSGILYYSKVSYFPNGASFDTAKWNVLPSVKIEQNLISNSTASVPSIAAVTTALTSKADLISGKISSTQMPYLGYTPDNVKSSVTNTADAGWSSGEMLDSYFNGLYAGSALGMEFISFAANGNSYYFKCVLASSDSNGAKATWLRLLR